MPETERNSFFPFMELPPELREKVYEYILSTEHVFEYYQSPTTTSGLIKILHSPWTTPWIKDPSKLVSCYDVSRLDSPYTLRLITPYNVNLLRVCRTVCKEAKHILKSQKDKLPHVGLYIVREGKVNPKPEDATICARLLKEVTRYGSFRAKSVLVEPKWNIPSYVSVLRIGMLGRKVQKMA